MDYRVEQKYLISDRQIEYLKIRLQGYMEPDANMQGEPYLIRSVYFDDMMNSCMHENEEGMDNREKFRIRTYNNNQDLIKLELKSKKRGYTSKKSAILTKKEADSLLRGESIFGTSEFLKTKLSSEMQYRRLLPVCIVEYERTAFVEAMGNVRITFDRNIGSSSEISCFWDDNMPVTPVLNAGKHILEIKYDELIPDYIKEIIDEGNLSKTAFSKYYFARISESTPICYTM